VQEAQPGRGIRATAVLAVALAAGLAVWLATRGGDSNGPVESVAQTTVVEAGEVAAATGSVAYPVYWAGPRPATHYEVSREPGQVYIKYLPAGTEPGGNRSLLTVGSYEDIGAVASLRKLGEEPGAIFRPAGGGFIYAEEPHANDLYLAFPGVGTQIEVYDPTPGEALRLIRSGKIVPVG
jgi:hypothetical protein